MSNLKEQLGELAAAAMPNQELTPTYLGYLRSLDTEIERQAASKPETPEDTQPIYTLEQLAGFIDTFMSSLDVQVKFFLSDTTIDADRRKEYVEKLDAVLAQLVKNSTFFIEDKEGITLLSIKMFKGITNLVTLIAIYKNGGKDKEKLTQKVNTLADFV